MGDLEKKVKEELCEGLIVKNYKEMCKLLDEEILSGGDSKKSQRKEWERYFDFEKSGQKYIVTEIYDTPLDKNDGRYKGLYVQYIEIILLKYLSQQKYITTTITKGKLYKLLGMVNENYNNVTLEELQKIDSRINSYNLNDFYLRSSRKLSSIIDCALKGLVKRFLIEYKTETVIVYTHSNKNKIANDEEISAIIGVKNDVLNQMGYKDINDVFCRYKQEDYYKKVNHMLNELYGYSFTYTQYKITFTHKNVKAELYKKDEELQKIYLNNEIIDYLNKQAVRNESRIVEKRANGEFVNYMHPLSYVDVQKKLADELINYFKKSLKERIDSYELDQDLLSDLGF